VRRRPTEREARVIRAVGPGRAELPIEQRWCSGDALFGGAAFAALVEAMTAEAAMPLLSATVQFVARGRRPGILSIESERLAATRALVHVRAQGSQEDALVAAATAVHVAEIPEGRLGRSEPPAVRAPDDCPPRPYQQPQPGSISEELDVRLAGDAGLTCRLWARWPRAGPGPMTAAVLALLADHVPFAPRPILGPEWYGTSLDGTLRVLPGAEATAADAWVLLDIGFELLGAVGHGSVWLWSADGTPLALAAQTIKVRRW
jgi:acyl-CoA thioesterase